MFSKYRINTPYVKCWQHRRNMWRKVNPIFKTFEIDHSSVPIGIFSIHTSIYCSSKWGKRSWIFWIFHKIFCTYLTRISQAHRLLGWVVFIVDILYRWSTYHGYILTLFKMHTNMWRRSQNKDTKVHYRKWHPTS